MAEPFYERLSPLDASFLALESRETHMHVAGVAIFEAGPLARPGGGIDIATLRSFIGSKLQYIPRYRQRLARVPLERSPVWVDDDHFSFDYHVRHTSLPRPGSEEQLKMLAGRICSQQLDRAKPLWELWIVEGLEGDRFATIAKIHHCMIDGMAGVDLMAVLMGFAPTEEIEPAPPWEPRPAPTGAELLVAEAARRTRRALDGARSLGKWREEGLAVTADLQRRLRATAHSLSSGWLKPSSKTPLNPPIGPNRRLDWLTLELDPIKVIKNALGGTVNDALLTIVAGAVRAFLLEREADVRDLDFRAMAPVSVRSRHQRGQMGNQVAMWLVQLPVGEANPVRRLRAIQRETQTLKETEQALGAATIVQVTAGAPTTLVALGARLAATVMRPFNLTVTNVPGPQFPIYLLGSRLLVQYPMVPLWAQHGLGVALFSYDGHVAWGLQADYDGVPDIGRFGEAIRESAEELVTAARRAAAHRPARRRARPKQDATAE